MKIPISFYLFGQEIMVRFSGNLETADAFANLGATDPLNNEITLLFSVNGTKINNNIMSQVFFHELVHHVLFLIHREDLSDDETFVDLFGSLLHQAITTMKYEDEVESGADVPR